VIVDGADDEEPGIMIARTKADAPDVDAVVYLDNATHLKPGDIVPAKITGADDYDLYATPT
jgi:ribosomal protein S12 methylthiotransferase